MTGVFKGGQAATDARALHGAAGYFEKPFEARKLLEAVRGLLPTPPPSRHPPPRPATELTDFDVEVAVESDEPVDAMELTGRVMLTEDGKVSAELRGETITAASMGAPARPPPVAQVPPPSAAAVREDEARRERAGARPRGSWRRTCPELITAFYLSQQTGELGVQRGKVKKVVYFENGPPLLRPLQPGDRPLRPVPGAGGEDQHRRSSSSAQAAADKTGRRTGDVLVECGLLKETERLYYVGQQVKAIIYSLFGWEDGELRDELQRQGRRASPSSSTCTRPTSSSAA